MKNGLIIIVVIAAILGIFGVISYNGLVSSEENVNQAWAKVESAYQRRADLIGNLVATVEKGADYEKGTLTDVIQARSNATSMKISADDLTPENIKKFQDAQESLNRAFMGRMNFLTENYPTLTATEGFKQLSTQIESTENRIKIERDRFNEEATIYNKKVRTFPTSIFAGMFGFERKGLFQAKAGAENAPSVRDEFNKK